MDYLTILIGTFFSFVFFKFLLISLPKSKTSQKLPPGPTPLPIIGNLHLLGAHFHKSILTLANAYGPIMLLKFGCVPTIIISSPETAKEILQKQDLIFSGKRVPDALRAQDHYKYSIVWLPANSQWRTLRRILNTNIFTNNRLLANKDLRFKKVEELIEYCRKKGQIHEVVEIGQAVFKTSLNILSNTIFSKDLADHYSDSSKEVKDAVWDILVESATPNLVDFFPLFGKIDPRGVRRRISGHFDKVLNIFDGLINERLEERRLGGNKDNDVLDVLLNYIEETPGEIDMNHVKRSCLDLFIAGVDTTASTVEWAMAELLKNRKIFYRVKEELEKFVGEGKLIDEANIAQLSYLDCIVKETLRLHPAAPILFPRTSDQDVDVCGYTIPKESQVLISILAIGRDPNLWEDPLEFKPERFIDLELDIRGHNFKLIPFGSGRRICPGMPLGTRMLPLILGSLVNSFDWKLEGDIASEELEMEEKVGGTVQKACPLRAVPICL